MKANAAMSYWKFTKQRPPRLAPSRGTGPWQCRCANYLYVVFQWRACHVLNFMAFIIEPTAQRDQVPRETWEMKIKLISAKLYFPRRRIGLPRKRWIRDAYIRYQGDKVIFVTHLCHTITKWVNEYIRIIKCYIQSWIRLKLLCLIR